MRTAGALLVTHIGVACLAWAQGYMTRALLERRQRELDVLFDATEVELDEFLDLVAEPDPPYDWAAEGVFEWPGGVTVHGPYPPNRETR